MNLPSKRQVLNRLLFSSPGLRIFPRVAPLLRRGYNLIVNNDLTPTVNGEYWLISRFPANGLYVDVGFHRGDWAAEVLSQHESARVFAFDPWPDAQTYYDVSPFSSAVKFYPVGLSDTEGTQVFYDYDSACNSLSRRDLEVPDAPKQYEIPVTTLDVWSQQIALEHIDLLKIDVEGHDLPVLMGAKRLLQANAIGAFVFEYGTGWIGSGRFLGEAAEYISASGYRLFKLFDGFLAPFAYTIQHETFAGAMYVGLSPRMIEAQTVPIRQMKI